MAHTLSLEQQADLAKRLDEAQAGLNSGRGFGVVKVIASLIQIGSIEDAKDMVLQDWDRFESLPVIGKILAEELVRDEIREFTRFRIKMEEK